jgi:hypothetical protein
VDSIRTTRTGLIAAAAAVALVAASASAAGAATAAAVASSAQASSAVTAYSGSAGTAARTARVRPAGPAVGSAASNAAASAKALGSVLANFNGTSSRDSQFTNYNLTFEPPDQGLCEGAGFVLEPVNSAYRIFRTNGTSLRGPFNVNDLFNEGGKEFTSDPRCWYDAPTHTWFAVILFIGATNDVGRIDIAVNPNPDPTGLWTEYQIDTTDDGRLGEPSNPGCPCFGDQPRLGIDQTNLYVSTDEFSILGPQFNGGQIYAIDKSDLINGVASAHFVHFKNLRIAGDLSIAPQPALSIGKPDAEYFLSELDPTGNGDHRIGVWAMTNRDKVGKGGMPRLTSTVIQSEAYSTPPPSHQRGGNSLLDSGDDRMQQVEFVGGSVWGELGTSIKPAGDTTARAGAAWFQVRPTLGANGIAGASITRQGYLSKAGDNVLYPAIQPNAAGNAAMVFTLVGKDRFASAAYSTLSAGSSAFGAPVVVAAGTGPYDKLSNRWGDYSFAVPDAVNGGAWLATEYMPPKSSQTTDGNSNWGTRVFEVSLG